LKAADSLQMRCAGLRTDAHRAHRIRFNLHYSHMASPFHGYLMQLVVKHTSQTGN
jgi:hypothetical protein